MFLAEAAGFKLQHAFRKQAGLRLARNTTTRSEARISRQRKRPLLIADGIVAREARTQWDFWTDPDSWK